jgi:ubiquinone/menaquinone biosynthesis C-methylase UbiE
VAEPSRDDWVVGFGAVLSPRTHRLPVKGQEWYQADSVAEEYEEKRFSRGGRLIDHREKQAVLQALAPLQDASVLEIAAGTGRFSVLLAERGVDVTAIDISEPMLRQGGAKASAAGVGENLHLLRGDAARLPFPDNHFDTVFAMRFFHLADTPLRFLSEMARVSRRQVFFDTFNAFSSRSVYNWILPMGSHLYTRDRVEGLLAETDLELARAEHDFVLPYGFYRQIPDSLAERFRAFDERVVSSAIGRHLATVSFWDARV